MAFTLLSRLRAQASLDAVLLPVRRRRTLRAASTPSWQATMAPFAKNTIGERMTYKDTTLAPFLRYSAVAAALVAANKAAPVATRTLPKVNKPAVGTLLGASIITIEAARWGRCRRGREECK